MRRLGVRLLMALVGVAVLAWYALAAAAVVGLAALLWRARPSLPTVAVAVLVLTLALGYASYRHGTADARSRLDAVALPRERAPGVHARLDRLCARMDVERPTLLLARLDRPNALALGGPRGGVLVLDRALFSLLDGDELTAIVAHELAHLESHDGLVQTLAYSALRTAVGLVVLALTPFVLVGTGAVRAVAWLRGRPATAATGTRRLRAGVARVVVVALLALTAVVRAHSRRREFAADDRAVEATGDPVALARALYKVHRAGEPAAGLLSALTVYGEEDDPLTRVLSTHPPMEDRIDRLLARADRPVERGPRRIEVR
jgi:heat shock protein HtpX